MRRSAATAALLAALACGPEQPDPPASSSAAVERAVAHIDGEPVDVAELSLTGDSARDQRAVDVLIARRLAAREARSRGLASQSETSAKLAALRREAAAREEEILRDALFASLRSALVLSDAELRAHYEKTRSRHTERRVSLRRQRFASKQEAEAFAAQLGREGKLDPAAAEAIPPAPADKLPADVIPEALRLARPGERVAIADEDGAAVVELVAIDPASPLSFEEARSAVEESLRTLRAQAAFRTEVERLRAAAEVDIDLAALRGASEKK